MNSVLRDFAREAVKGVGAIYDGVVGAIDSGEQGGEGGDDAYVFNGLFFWKVRNLIGT